MSRAPFSFYEFFAGGGMARLGLGEGWACGFANDFDPVKAATYRGNFLDAGEHFHEGDVWAIATIEDLEGAIEVMFFPQTYQLFATGTERGADLAGALLALSEDLRDARREQLHKDAVRKRAAMLVPTIAILAPIMLLFIAAPLPSIVLGYR